MPQPRPAPTQERSAEPVRQSRSVRRFPRFFRRPPEADLSEKNHCQRKILNATANDRMPHAAIIPIRGAWDDRDDPSSMTDRKASIKGVSGKILIRGCTADGNRSEVKKMPESIHIGNITRFINPETASIVFARLATNNPIPANIVAPIRIKSATV